MAKAGDLGFEAIQQLGNQVPLLVQNDGSEHVQLWLEPFVQDYCDCVTVWATSWFATVTDCDGNEFPQAARSAPES
ncbi:hypothetical protein ACFWR9_25010 [Streptomyces sp. NPDC058534]|uniref:hypothetical protein n=1 Tax=Streptomyces sp. NPDC058534 TaxID=3346541 RepID=UPI00364C11ED